MGEDHDREPRCAETRTRRYGGERLPYEPGSTESVVAIPRKGVALALFAHKKYLEIKIYSCNEHRLKEPNIVQASVELSLEKIRSAWVVGFLVLRLSGQGGSSWWRFHALKDFPPHC